MKIQELSPTGNGVRWHDGRTHKAGAWCASDWSDSKDNCGEYGPIWQYRSVFHYGTEMIRFVRADFIHVDGQLEPGRWTVVPVSTGWGSVSDQQGVNKVLGGYDGWYYSRKGGAEYVKR